MTGHVPAEVRLAETAVSAPGTPESELHRVRCAAWCRGAAGSALSVRVCLRGIRRNRRSGQERNGLHLILGAVLVGHSPVVHRAAGDAILVLCRLRIAHPGLSMGQVEVILHLALKLPELALDALLKVRVGAVLNVLRVLVLKVPRLVLGYGHLAVLTPSSEVL
jgi:hypothetical protein